MNMTYNEAIDWIHSRLRLGIKPGLSRMEWMMERLGHPERNIRAIHVAGTNGKGSTVSYIRSILQEAGYLVGTFTSPYIEQFNERISVNEVPISNEEIAILASKIKPLSDELENTELGGPTEFEIITAMSLYYFGKMNPMDFVVYEVGLGGRFDSTNIIYPLVTVITTVGLDHTAILGDTIEQIAFEKAGIIKSGVPVVTGVHQEEALQVISKIAKEHNAAEYIFGKDFFVYNQQSTEKGETFTFQSERSNSRDLQITMKGSHQVLNASLAIKAVEYLQTYFSVHITEADIRDGLEKMFWVGRFEKLCEKPLIYVDGAHNPEGVNELVKTVKSHLNGKSITTLFSALQDKKLDDMIKGIDEISDNVVFTSFDFPRAASAEQLRTMFPEKKYESIQNYKQAIDSILLKLDEDQVLLITGSLYFISEVRKYILKKG
ncbi:bifunctional folylpolyglutamate synthase/dihydrofolate synthase [Bacillus suaedaesalsae]|uniref:tetrahydrofolate synthase n=1 Tax=Bacillus suaedaesalsae TaxID=2810349 RepID=A0ABS2DMN4_9BACI|nr:folylpolyglutamate synthase/dihydrofolate synthase family protein [Bacillus suaedaesalsae]MBM6619765.1 bifunctional folylpolyglutamate synthase/dihydrofolate synthase [Bacillus suaedaesalsae]